jgi:hypothetical protein
LRTSKLEEHGEDYDDSQARNVRITSHYTAASSGKIAFLRMTEAADCGAIVHLVSAERAYFHDFPFSVVSEMVLLRC